MENQEQLNGSSPSVQTHISILQSVIERMAGNSTSCKAWSIAIVSAILVVLGDKESPRLIPVLLVPLVLFFSLDVYYLALEKAFRDSYNSFVKKVHSRELVPQDLYWIETKGQISLQQLRSICSFSVWGFYLGLTLMTILAWLFVI